MNDTDDMVPKQETPFDRATEEFEYERRRFEREQEEALKGEDHQAEFRFLMWMSGRANFPTDL